MLWRNPCRRTIPSQLRPGFKPPKLPDWFWDGGISGTGDFTHLPPERASIATEQMLTDAESRVERLRGLFANVGLANLHRNRGPLLPDE